MSVLTAPEGHPDHCSLCRVRHMTRAEADLRDRLALFAEHVCQGCGCAVAMTTYLDGDLCADCDCAGELPVITDGTAAACISVGMRALAGRRILPV